MDNNIKKNRKGFTLIELLAVIIIMAVLLMTALPAVTQAITRSRRDTYATNAKKFIDAVRTNIIGGELFVEGQNQQGGVGSPCQTPAPGKYVAVQITGITLERGGTTSSFGQNYKDGYVIIANTETDATKTDKFDYYFIGVDAGNNGVDDYIVENNLRRSVVKSGNAEPGTKITAVKTGPLTLGSASYTLDAICVEE